MIKIGKLFIEKETINGVEYSSLCSFVKFRNEESKIKYSVLRKYEKYLCYEHADCFVVGLLPLALNFGEDICCENPVSTKLFWYLTRLYIPSVCNSSWEFKNCKLIADTDSKEFGGKEIGTAVSCGVDSFYTIFENLNEEKTKEFNISMLTLFNVGAFSGKEAAINYKEKVDEYSKVADGLNLKFFSIDSNIHEFVKMNFDFTVTFFNISAVLSVQKLFKRYFISSTVRFNEFEILANSSARFDLLNCHAFSTETVEFFSVGSNKRRSEKIEYISRYSHTYDKLNVCYTGKIRNCGVCEKCLRTQMELYSLGKLNLYKESFDVEKYLKNLDKNISKEIAASANNKITKECLSDTIKNCKKNKIRFPFISYIYATPNYLINCLAHLCSKSKILKIMWHRYLMRKYKHSIRLSDE